MVRYTVNFMVRINIFHSNSYTNKKIKRKQEWKNKKLKLLRCYVYADARGNCLTSISYCESSHVRINALLLDN